MIEMYMSALREFIVYLRRRSDIRGVDNAEDSGHVVVVLIDIAFDSDTTYICTLELKEIRLTE
jgi:hypothetical protein